MGIDGGLISGYANLTQGLRSDAEQRKQKMISNVTDSVGGLGRIYAEKQAGDAIRQTLVSQFGADPAEVDNVMRQGPQAVAEYAKKKHGEMQAKKALQALGYDATLGVDPGSPSSSFFQPQTIPPSVKAAVTSGNVPMPVMGEGDVAPQEPGIKLPSPSSVGGVPMSAGAGSPLPPPPSAAPAADPYDAFLRRAAGMPGLDAETLGLAAKFLPPRPKQPDPMLPEELDRIRAQTDEARAAAEAHRRPPKETAPRAENPDYRVLTAEDAQAMGWPTQWVNGRTTFGQAQAEATRLGIGKPDKETPDVENFAKSAGVPYFRGMTFNDVQAEYKKLHPEAKDTTLTDLLKLLTVNQMRTQQASYEGPELRRAMATYNDLVERSRNLEKANLYTNAAGGVGPKALEADIDAAWKKVEEIRAKPQELPPVPTRGDVGLPPPPGAAGDAGFEAWKQANAPQDSGFDYDLQAAYKAGVSRDSKGHMPDTYKQPWHPSFSTDSAAAKTNPDLAGTWTADGQYQETPAHKYLMTLPDEGKKEFAAMTPDERKAVLTALGRIGR